MLVALIGGYFLLVFSASLVFTQDITNPFLVAIVVFLMALLFLPVRTFLQTRIDKLYYRVRLNYQDRLEVFAHDTTQLPNFNAIVTEFVSQLNETVEPSSIFIFLLNRQATAYTALSQLEPTTEVQFGHETGIVEALNQNDQMIYLDSSRPWPIPLRSERPRLTILNAMVILGLPGGKQLNGFICVGPPRSGRRGYNYEELLFLQNLSTQMAIATERAQVVESLERRVQELDVLSQVSQAVNFTINFDDLLELISAQTSKLIEAAYFYIALRDEVTDELYFAFFLEDDERYREKEDRRWQMGRDVFSEVAHTGQAMRIANYGIAASQRGAPGIAIDSNLKAWMGVPLIAGPRTLGVMAVGTPQSGKTYGDDQFKVFSDIGALAATSIDKARLFEETNRRARQLAALNNISHQLAGELDVQKLLELVTRTAVDILNAEAGSLLLNVDDGSNDLEFKIAIGSAGQKLVGMRFSSKRGFVGEVATKGKPIIVNDASKDPRWGGELSKGDFRTNAILAVPLLAKSRIVGVLEVLNKKDGGVYVQEDADLLTTFAGQAAVAIENARLFQMTDLQLSARVDELETLERIDVELNRSLDLHRVAEITMRWAIANSGATAGVLGLVFGDPPHLEIVAKYGYTEDEFPEGAEGNIWPLDRGIVSRVIRTRQPDIATDVSIDPSYIPSLRGCLSQITVPMMSGGEISGILILETNKEPRLNLVDLSFVQRLAEHASIALTNAQLYAELARANDSKSEFVSFVAHELKTPMTSIKGFTDLLLGGLTGNLNEKQQSFLGTIRSNIDRMNTLVSDLNDVTKLQTNNLHMEFSPIDFRNVLTETLRPLQKQIEDKQQRLLILMDDDLPPIMADQNRLIQVLTNLLSNAYKYTPRQGEIRIKADTAANRWDPKAKKDDQVLHIQVQDSGIGMSEEDLIKLFTPYFRSENPLAREQPGTGLGLTITHGIIRRHNGQIWVESKIGEGTTFHFIIPLAIETAPQPSK
jgi:signal transduction histidine kinase